MVFSHDTKVTGQLVNISQRGLAVRYTPQPAHTTEFEIIDILGIYPQRLILLEIGCEKTYDISVLTESLTFTGSATRLCGLQFIRLTGIQKEKLSRLLKNCDTGFHKDTLTRGGNRPMIGSDPLSGSMKNSLSI
jgi:hypothetical protein